jgi:hypothetical protein
MCSVWNPRWDLLTGGCVGGGRGAVLWTHKYKRLTTNHVPPRPRSTLATCSLQPEIVGFFFGGQFPAKSQSVCHTNTNIIKIGRL